MGRVRRRRAPRAIEARLSSEERLSLTAGGLSTFGTTDMRRKAWEAHRDGILARWDRPDPPEAWWQFDAVHAPKRLRADLPGFIHTVPGPSPAHPPPDDADPGTVAIWRLNVRKFRQHQARMSWLEKRAA